MKKNCINTYGPIVIAGFPGTGKSTFVRKIMRDFQIGIDVYDSDSSKHKENWPDGYISHILALIEDGKKSRNLTFIMVSTHKEVLQKLVEAGVRFTIVVPKKDDDIKEIYIDRYHERGSDEKFCELLSQKWDSFIDDIFSFKGNPLINIVTVCYEYIEDLFYQWFNRMQGGDINNILLPFGMDQKNGFSVFDWIYDYIDSEYDFGYTKQDLINLIGHYGFSEIYLVEYIRTVQIIEGMDK